ncbi:MAG: prefoldin subunit alpha [Candidatus Poseidoniia archaeon]|nr:prefoldin subunit alpha [Candidatus Poseidoniia archaeon]MDP6533615.1 prefoldin subunit alpha [Candidatus Poseidoniia archaeon]MDP6834913.1 prefoldin subunit alpha [Candidatus Poseidoniia archaeon]HIH78841.1 prefoldin subunit alpha [Candidatus Poseidoniia archaeon]
MSDDETELQQLVDTLAQVEQQIRAWEAQLETLSSVRTEIWQARTSLDGLQQESEGREMLVPVGYNTSLFATLGSKERVLTGLGSRVYMEASLDEALERLQTRLEEVEKATRNYRESLVQLQNQHAQLRQRAEALYAQAEAVKDSGSDFLIPGGR